MIKEFWESIPYQIPMIYIKVTLVCIYIEASPEHSLSTSEPQVLLIVTKALISLLRHLLKHGIQWSFTLSSKLQGSGLIRAP